MRKDDLCCAVLEIWGASGYGDVCRTLARLKRGECVRGFWTMDGYVSLYPTLCEVTDFFAH